MLTRFDSLPYTLNREEPYKAIGSSHLTVYRFKKEALMQGYKTEPARAFAQFFGIAGDAHVELIKLASCSPEELEKMFQSETVSK